MDFVLILSIVLLLLQQQVGALKLFGISVPSYVIKGQSTRLVCRYDLESDKLYAVSWYKDNEQFYQYVPQKDMKKHTYDVEGVNINHQLSDQNHVQLNRMILKSSGRYKCEVSTDGPPFKTEHLDAFMEVISLPEEGPKITGEERIYASGDVLSLNCTSGKSHPAARLRWFINNVQVDADEEVTFQESHGLSYSISSLRLELGPDHLSKGKINIKCESTVQPSVQSSSTNSKPLIDIRDTKIFVQGKASLSTPSITLLLVLVTSRLVMSHLVIMD